MTVTVFLLIALLYLQATFTVPSLLVKTKTSIQNHQMVQKEFDNIASQFSRRQDELIQLGRLDGLDLTRSDWIHKQVEICSEFSNHIFVQYQEKGEPNEAFMAIYPRTMGKIHIVRQGIGPNSASRFSTVRASTITAFNAIWLNERRYSNLKAVSSDLDWIKLATCYAELAGEYSAARTDIPNIYSADKFTQTGVEHGRIIIVGIKIGKNPVATTDLSIEFNRLGFIKRVTRTESAWPTLTQ